MHTYVCVYWTRTYVHTYTQACTHIYTSVYTHTHTHAHTQRCRQTDRHTHTHTQARTHIITPVLVSEDTLLDGDNTVPLGSVNKSDELVPTLPICSDDDSFDAALAPTLACSIPVEVNAFCG